jgi:hypothetical protein
MLGERDQQAKVGAEELGESETLERAQNLRDPFRDGIQRVDNVAFALKGYESSHIGLEMHVRVRPRGNHGEAKYFIARLTRWRQIPTILKNSIDGDAIHKLRRREVIKNPRDAVHILHFPVFVRVRISRQCLQRVENTLRPKRSIFFERLELFNLCSVRADHVFPMRMRGPVVFIRNDGKLDVSRDLAVGRLDTFVFPNSELPCEVIQGTSQVMDGISKEKAQSSLISITLSRRKTTALFSCSN